MKTEGWHALLLRIARSLLEVPYGPFTDAGIKASDY